MYKFLRNVSTMTGKNFAAGSIVPDGVFGNLAEMVKAKDIAEVEVILEAKNEDDVFEPITGIDDESTGEEFTPEEIKKAENARKARERRAAAKAGN
jgi:hypothetical protein